MELRIARVLPAPAATVFEAWTSPAPLTAWWWPPRFKTAVEIQLQVGGVYRIRSRGLGAENEIEVFGEYRSVDPPERLEYTWRWAGEQHETTVEAVFAERSDRTELRLTHAGFTSEQERDNHVQGWNDCLDRLVDYLQGEAARRSEPAKP
jgi:uncharacterized protein YndB with AHSA1/START domain